MNRQVILVRESTQNSNKNSLAMVEELISLTDLIKKIYDAPQNVSVYSKTKDTSNTFVKEYVQGYDEESQKYIVKFPDNHVEKFYLKDIDKVFSKVMIKDDWDYIDRDFLENELTKGYRRFFKAGDLVISHGEYLVLKRDEKSDGGVYVEYDDYFGEVYRHHTHFKLILPAEEVEKIPPWKDKN